MIAIKMLVVARALSKHTISYKARNTILEMKSKASAPLRTTMPKKYGIIGFRRRNVVVVQPKRLLGLSKSLASWLLLGYPAGRASRYHHDSHCMNRFSRHGRWSYHGGGGWESQQFDEAFVIAGILLVSWRSGLQSKEA